MSLETSISNVVIKGNTIDQGSSSTGSAPVQYLYDLNAWIFASSVITDNSFLSPSASTDILSIDDCSCVITNNKFVRGTTSINSYIRNYGSNDQVITDNIFDQHTIDGTVEDLVIGLSTTSIYQKNRNQTAYKAFALGDMHIFGSATGGFGIYADSTNRFSVSLAEAANLQAADPQVGFSGENYIVIQDISSGGSPAPTQRVAQKYIGLDYNLPDNVTILDLKVGIWQDTLSLPLDFTSPLSNLIFLTLVSYKDMLTSNSANGITDVKNNLEFITPLGDISENTVAFAKLALVGSGDQAALQSATNYLEIDTTNYSSTDISSNFVVNQRYRIIVRFDLYYLRATGGVSGHINFYVSPVVVKYRW